MQRSSLGSLATLLGVLASPTVLAAQAAVDPSIAPRAAQLASSGQRERATEMLGGYLATAPDDGAAWLELGKLYLADSRDWHRMGHAGQPPASLFLDFAAAALDQSLRLPTDSGALVRALVEIDRAAGEVEVEGWSTARSGFRPMGSAVPPTYVAEVGRNLVNSCPVGGVLVTGTDLEAVAAWSAALEDRAREDLVLLLAQRFVMDSLYRLRMAQALGIAPDSTTRAALTDLSLRRPVCLSPATDTAATPLARLTAVRMVRIAGAATPESSDPLSVVELLEASFAHPDAVSSEVLGLYREAARFNPLLCSSLLAPLGAPGRDGCGR